MKQGLYEAGKPHDREQQRDACQHRNGEAGNPGYLPARRWQAPHQNRDENNVVEAENDLEQRQRYECQPGLRIGEQSGHCTLRGARRWLTS